MVNRKMGIVVAGNEYNRVDTLKILATAVRASDNIIGQIVGQGMLDEAEGIANSPAYVEAVEVLGLYLATLVDGDAEDADEDEDNEEEDEEEEEEEEETVTTCHECGEVVSTKKGTYLAGYFFCKDCITTAWTEV